MMHIRHSEAYSNSSPPTSDTYVGIVFRFLQEPYRKRFSWQCLLACGWSCDFPSPSTKLLCSPPLYGKKPMHLDGDSYLFLPPSLPPPISPSSSLILPMSPSPRLPTFSTERVIRGEWLIWDSDTPSPLHPFPPSPSPPTEDRSFKLVPVMSQQSRESSNPYYPSLSTPFPLFLPFHPVIPGHPLTVAAIYRGARYASINFHHSLFSSLHSLCLIPPSIGFIVGKYVRIELYESKIANNFLYSECPISYWINNVFLFHPP